MANPQNLTPWKPGQSGNPGGRPKRDAITSALEKQLALQSPGETQETVADAIAGVLIKRALSGDVRAIREIADRTEGRPTQQVRVETSADDNGPPKMDLSRLSDDQLRQLDEIISAATS